MFIVVPSFCDIFPFYNGVLTVQNRGMAENKPGTLILLRHGQSEWNASNQFTGWVDVDLTEKGEAEAKRGGQLLAQHHARGTARPGQQDQTTDGVVAALDGRTLLRRDATARVRKPGQSPARRRRTSSASAGSAATRMER